MSKLSLQIVSLIGNATKDAELKVSKDGVSYVSFRLAVSGQEGATTFYNVLLFGHYGEVMQEHITRGRQIYVNGRLQISDKGYVSVIADHIELLARPKVKMEERLESETPPKEEKPKPQPQKSK